MPAVAWSDLTPVVEPVPAWRFYCTMPTIPGLSTDGQKLCLLAQRFVATARGVDYEQVPFNAGSRNFPVGHHVEAISAQFIENPKFDVSKYLRGWIDLVCDENGVMGMPADYKRPIQVDSIDETGKVIATFKYKFCAPTRPDPIEFDGSQTAFISRMISFVVDNETSLPDGTYYVGAGSSNAADASGGAQ